jgi:hypothetical protein
MINVPPANLTSKFTITYTGSIYKGRQDPSKLFDALHDLILDGIIDPRDVEVRFYGDKERWLAKEIEKYGLSGIVKLYERVPKRVIFEKQRESQILLLFNWEDQKGRGWHSLKIYDYIAASRPILATGGLYNNVIKEILDETKTGIYCKEVDDIKNALEELYLQYKLKGKAIYKGDIEKINKYSQLEMTRKFAEILNTVKDKKV